VPHLALNFDLAPQDAVRAEAACLAAGALAITLSDARDEPVLEPLPGEVRLWSATRVQALFRIDAPREAVAAALCRELSLVPARLSFAVLTDRAWEREWLRDFHAQRFEQRLWVCPHHETVTQAGAAVVHLDPGLAFGTGTHPSTALCLEWLDGHLQPGSTVIDYGCGSGILSLAAAKLGAVCVDAFDIDPLALLATAQNADANACAAGVRVWTDPAQLPGPADLLLANILAGTLCSLAADLATLVRRGGALVLAGILAEQADVVAAVYAPWFDITLANQSGDWVLLAGKRI